MSHCGKLTPNLDQKGTKTLNLTVLQRIDPFIHDILLTSAHVAFYHFNIDLNQWSRKDVEGSLFVVKRNVEPWYQFIVMNRRSTENLVENLLGDFEYEIQMPYLLYKNAAQEVNGIWFYNTRECEEVANLINRIIDSYPKIQSKPQVSNQSDFRELEPAPSMSVMDGPLEPSPISSNAADVNEISSSLTNFFNTATNLGNNGSYSGRPVQTYHPSNVQSTSLGMSNPTVGALQVSSTVTSFPSIPQPHNQSVSDMTNRNNPIANLLKPSSFYTPQALSHVASVPPVSSSMPPIAPQPSLTSQRPYGAPLLQPFPPPTPSPSLTPHNASLPSYNRPIIDRDKVRGALMILVQDNQFIDMICTALQKVHQV